jgi:hypothetical protein
MIINAPPTLNSTSIADLSVLAPDGLNWSYGAAISNDPESLAYTRSLEFNGSTTIPSWIIVDFSTYTFSIISTSNNINGTHTITIVIEDEFNAPVRSSDFQIQIIPNYSPLNMKFIDGATIVNYNYLSIQFEDVHVLFIDPDDRPMTSTVMQANGDPLPSFLTYDIATNTMFGTPEFIHVRTWTLIYVGIDDHGNTGDIHFKVIVEPCYYKCNNCTTNDYNQCTSCHIPYYFQYGQ